MILGFAAINTGNNLIYIIESMLLSIILISGILGFINIKNLDIALLQAEDFYANRHANVKIIVVNRCKKLFLFLLKLKIENAEVALDAVKCSSQSEYFTSISFRKRGINKIEGVYVTSSYPFNFFIRGKYFKLNKQFLVYPEPKKPSEEFAKIINDKKPGESTGSNIFVNEFADINGLRKYVIGDQIKHINWKSFYRDGNILVKKYESSSVEPVTIEIKHNNNIEESLSFATFIINDCYKKNIPVGLNINGTFYRPSTGLVHRNILLKKLALYNEGSINT